jgi:hypothetical protein
MKLKKGKKVLNVRKKGTTLKPAPPVTPKGKRKVNMKNVA